MRYGFAPRETYWDLAESEAAQRRRGTLLRGVYALADPTGWDARRLAQEERVTLQRIFRLREGAAA